MRRRAVFIDKDGTLVEDVPYNVDPARIALAPGAGTALRRLRAAGYALVVVSNQSGVARGYFPEPALAAVEIRIRELLAAPGAGIDAFLYCPHLPDGAVPAYAVRCDCRKPAPGLLLQAAATLQLDLHASWMVGDILDDVEAGNRAGCRTVLLDVGHETEWRPGAYRRPTACAPDLLAAAELILDASQLPSPPWPLSPLTAAQPQGRGELRSQLHTRAQAPLSPAAAGERGWGMEGRGVGQ